MILDSIFDYVLNRIFLLQAVTTLATYLSIRVITVLNIRRKRHKLFKFYGIPGPEPSLLDGSLSVYLSNKSTFKIEEDWTKKYGRLYGYFIGDEPKIIITDLELLRKVFFEESRNFKERTRTFINNTLTTGILFAEHSRWKLMRKTMSVPFGRYNRGNSTAEFIRTSLDLMIKYIDDKLSAAESCGKTPEIDIHSLMKSTTLHMISNMAINLPNVAVKEDEENVKSLDSYLALSDQSVLIFAIKYPFIKPFIEFIENHFEHNSTLAHVHKGLNENINEYLNKLRKGNLMVDQSSEQVKIMETLIRLLHENKLSREEVIGCAEAILFAGYDTASTASTYTIWVLSKYTEIQEKLRAEIMTHGLDSEYLEQVLNETLRMYPVAVSFTTRLATSSFLLDDRWVIPQGALVVHNAWLLHHDPEIWPDPEKFDPNRFSPGTKIHPCAYAPFGLGERKCLGYQVAMLEMKMIICDLLMRYRFRLKSPDNLELVSYAFALTKSKDKVVVELERLQ